MRRPQFSLKTLLWLTALAGVVCWIWINMEPISTGSRLVALVGIFIGVGLIALMARESKQKKVRLERAAKDRSKS